MNASVSAGSFASLEERVAHLNWRKVCNERQIQETIRQSKQLQERDEFIRAAKNDGRVQREWMHGVITQELHKPLPVTEHLYQQIAQQQVADDAKARAASKRHMTQLKTIQAKLDAREDEWTRKRDFERKKKELFGSAAVGGSGSYSPN